MFMVLNCIILLLVSCMWNVSQPVTRQSAEEPFQASEGESLATMLFRFLNNWSSCN